MSFEADMKAINEHVDRMLSRVAKLESENAELAELLAVFAALLQDHHADMPDSQPLFGINAVTINVGQLRAARALLSRIGGEE